MEALTFGTKSHILSVSFLLAVWDFFFCYNKTLVTSTVFSWVPRLVTVSYQNQEHLWDLQICSQLSEVMVAMGSPELAVDVGNLEDCALNLKLGPHFRAFVLAVPSAQNGGLPNFHVSLPSPPSYLCPIWPSQWDHPWKLYFKLHLSSHSLLLSVLFSVPFITIWSHTQLIYLITISFNTLLSGNTTQKSWEWGFLFVYWCILSVYCIISTQYIFVEWTL